MEQACNQLPFNADAGVPWEPFRDPAYLRADIDAMPFLLKERASPPERPVVDAIAAERTRLPLMDDI